jgi:hypothetical protein
MLYSELLRKVPPYISTEEPYPFQLRSKGTFDFLLNQKVSRKYFALRDRKGN